MNICSSPLDDYWDCAPCTTSPCIRLSDVPTDPGLCWVQDVSHHQDPASGSCPMNWEDQDGCVKAGKDNDGTAWYSVNDLATKCVEDWETVMTHAMDREQEVKVGPHRHVYMGAGRFTLTGRRT